MANEKKLPTFGLIEKYNEEGAKNLELLEKHSAQVNESQALVTALEYRYEQELTKLVKEGKDGSKQLDEISEQLSAAERDLANKKRMMQVAKHLNKRKITKEDIEQELREYQEKYQVEVITPAIKELRQLKEAYIAKFLEVKQKIDHFDVEARNAFFTVNQSYKGMSIPYGVGFRGLDNVRHKCITDVDLIELDRGLQPSSLKPRTKPVKGIDGITRFEPLAEDVEGDNE